MEALNSIDLFSDEKVIDLLETKDHLSLAKFLGKELCDFNENDEMFIDMFWDAAFNKSWLYVSEEIVNEQFGYKSGKNTMSHFYEKLKKEYEENVDYKIVDKDHNLIKVGSQNFGSKISAHNKQYYIITGETYKALLQSAQTKQGKITRKYFIKIETLANLTNQVIYKHLEYEKNKQIDEIKDMKSKMLNLTDYIHNEEKLVKDEWVYIATSKTYSVQNQYRLGRCAVLNKRMQQYQVGRAKNDELYYVFTHNCANSALLEHTIQKLLKKYRDAPTKDIYVIDWSILEKFLKEICKLHDKQIDATNILINSNLKGKQRSTSLTFNLKSITNVALRLVTPKIKLETKKIQNDQLTQINIGEIEKRIIDNWSDDGYFISMYDMLLYCDLPCKYNKDFRKSFKIKLETRSLILADDINDLKKDYCMVKEKVNGSSFNSNVPYLSVSGFNKYYNHKKTFKPDRIKLKKIVEIMKKMDDSSSEDEIELIEMEDMNIDESDSETE